MNILVTGGCGFIGINLISYLLSESKAHRIRVIDNLSVGKREDLTEIQRTEVRGRRAKLRDDWDVWTNGRGRRPSEMRYAVSVDNFTG